MADDCCKVVGNLDLGIDGCFISVNSSCSTEMSSACGVDTPLPGPTIQTVNLTAYAGDDLHIGCSASAQVSINWIRKFDCDNDITYFLFAGEGESSIIGDVGNLAELKNEAGTNACVSLSASSQGGPASIFTETTQTNGYGLIYRGDPIDFITDEGGTSIRLGGILAGDYYLQSFSLDLQPGQLPVANYVLVRGLTNGG
jgi:hypothetical protein